MGGLYVGAIDICYYGKIRISSFWDDLVLALISLRSQILNSFRESGFTDLPFFHYDKQSIKGLVNIEKKLTRTAVFVKFMCEFQEGFVFLFSL